MDDDKKYYKKNYKGIPIHIGIENAKNFNNCNYVFGIGSYKNKNAREKIFKKMNLSKELFPNIVDPSAKIEDNVSLGFGNIIYPFSVVCSGTAIKDFCILTYSVILAHDVKIGSFTILGSRTSILNNADIGKEVFFGEVTRRRNRRHFTNGLACTEPCAFPNCLKTCRHELHTDHTEHTEHKVERS